MIRHLLFMKRTAPGIVLGAVVFLATAFVALADDAPALQLPSIGAADARVQLIVVNEFGCPACRRGKILLHRVLAQYGDLVRVSFVHNPRPAFAMSAPAAAATIAAANQGQFWALHDLLFSTPGALDEDALRSAATALAELDSSFVLEQWEGDRDSAETREQVARQRSMALATGATATPTYFVNGRLLTGNIGFGDLSAVIDEELIAAEDTGSIGDEWLRQRLKANNPDLHAYLFEGQVPTREFLEAREVVETASANSGKRVIRAIAMPADFRYPVTVRPDDPVRGAADALVTLVEFSDFQCPSCRGLAPILRELLQRYPKDVRLVFKQEPLGYHSLAMRAAEASLCAHDQGAFWGMHDRMFDGGLQSQQLESYAESLDLDLGAWKQCVEKGAHRDRIKEDAALARKVKALGTPHTFFNGRKVAGVRSVDWFSTLVDTELARARALIADGTPPGQVYARTIAGESAAPEE